MRNLSFIEIFKTKEVTLPIINSINYLSQSNFIFMCLFKKDDQENSCTHEECKNYYLLNRQTCVYPKTTDAGANTKANKPTNFSGDEQNLLDLLQKKIKKDSKRECFYQRIISLFFFESR